MATIFRKTAKGVDEIATRANRLAPRLRSALILVDGSRDDAELGKMIAQHPTETLEMLAELGFIEAAAVIEPPPRPVKPSPPPSAPAGPQSFNSFRAEAVRAFNDLIGPMGEALAMKMEKTTSREQLAPLLDIAFQVIGNSRNAQSASDFKARFSSS